MVQVALEVFDLPLQNVGSLLSKVRNVSVAYASVFIPWSALMPCMSAADCTAASRHAALVHTLQVPPPLAIGSVELEDGATVKGFICESHVAKVQCSTSGIPWPHAHDLLCHAAATGGK